MSARWIRVPTGARERAGSWLAAGIAAVGVGTVTFYLTRLFLSREPLPGTGVAEARPDEPTGHVMPGEGDE